MVRFSFTNTGFMVGRDGASTLVIGENEITTYQGALALGDASSHLYKSGKGGNEIKVEAKVSDIINHFQGNMGRDDFMNSVNVERITVSNEPDPQLAIFVAMFYRLYQKDLSSTFYMSRQPLYSKISNLGVLIDAKVYSSNSWSKGKYDMPTINKEGLTLKERNAEVQKMLPRFENEFKENIINYARTIRSEDDNQTIIFDVRMTQCEGCEGFPKYINFLYLRKY